MHRHITNEMVDAEIERLRTEIERLRTESAREVALLLRLPLPVQHAYAAGVWERYAAEAYFANEHERANLYAARAEYFLNGAVGVWPGGNAGG
jgi:hypothetical protein